MLAPRSLVLISSLLVITFAGCASLPGPLPRRTLSPTRKETITETVSSNGAPNQPESASRATTSLDEQPTILLTGMMTELESEPFWPQPQMPTLLDVDPLLVRLPPVDGPEITFSDALAGHWDQIRSDHAEYYSAEGLTWLAAGLSAGALMANTAFDEHFLRDTYAENVVLAPSHEFYERLHQPKVLGDGWYTIPAFALVAFSEPLLDRWEFGHVPAEWGRRSLRTILVGAPPMLVLQVLTGGSRPGETSSQSHWKPLQDNNGVSGHSFMGAVPFMSAAKMTDNGWLKAGLYAASALPALSRVNDDQHYFSQSFLGWWLAYAAASAVHRTESSKARFHILPLPQPDGFGVAIQFDR